MKSPKPKFVVVSRVQGPLAASIIKGHLESEGIPAVLRYESAGQVLGILVDGLGQVEILVPEEFAEVAAQIIEPVDQEEDNE